MLSRVHSAGLHGIAAYPVTVEVDLASQGLPGWHLVGLPETVVRESKDRVTSALRNAGFRLRFRKTTINLAPAHQRKQGNFFDLPIAMGLLVAAQLLPADVTQSCLFAGELLLAGQLHPIHGALSLALLARDQGKTLVIPAANEREISIVRGLTYVAAATLGEVVRHFTEQQSPTVAVPDAFNPQWHGPDLADVRGQPVARRALEVAAAGDHHLLLHGPPGTGKTMLAQRLSGILTPLTYEEAIESTQIYSAAGEPLPYGILQHRPFRAPHHTASAVGLAGGGAQAQVGEISLAHHGVLFLDELPEFHRDAIEVLRQPLESHQITITRAAQRVRFPARFLCVASCNPCRCGYLGHPTIPCQCSLAHVQSYRSKLSGPLLDRLDLHVSVPPVDPTVLIEGPRGESSDAVRTRVLAARARQQQRYGKDSLTNGQLGAAQTRELCQPTAEARTLLQRMIERQGISARAYDRILRVARTIADLEAATDIAAPHVAEAIQYRTLDRPL